MTTGDGTTACPFIGITCLTRHIRTAIIMRNEGICFICILTHHLNFQYGSYYEAI